MAEYVDVLVDPENRIVVTRELDEWDREHGENLVRIIGNESGRVLFCDVPPAALERLDRLGIRYDTRPRPAGRPLPVPVATLRGVAGA